MKFNENGETKFNEGVEAQGNDAYGLRCFSYAKEWAEFMEAQIAESKRVADVAQATADQADTDGITGFMYGMAVSILAKTWAYGEDLRKWHNHEYDPDNTSGAADIPGATINPAILTITTKD